MGFGADVSRRYAQATAVGGIAGLLVFTWMITGGTFHLLPHYNPLLSFYDIQGRALLHGHWNVPAGPAWIEGFLIGHKTYLYFGPWPAILRMPVLVLTHRFDGRLGVISMILSDAVALWAGGRLLADARHAIRGDHPVTRAEWCTVVVAVFVLGTGSTFLFLAGAPIVYHEAALWGAALALAAYHAIIAWCRTPRGRTLASAGVLSALALLSRPSVGIGPVVALGLILIDRAIALVRNGSPWLSSTTPERNARRASRDLGSIALAVLVPVLLYGYQNEAKFGSVYNVPWAKQIYSQFSPSRRAALAANGNRLFGTKLIPTSLVQYLRPDALRVGWTFPFVDFSGQKPHVFFGGVFDTLDHASSITATMPLLCVLAALGAICAFAGRSSRRPWDLRSWRAPIIASVVAIVPTVAIAFVAQRYLSDFVPGLVLGGALGFAYVLRATQHSAPGSRFGARRGTVAGLLALLGAFSIVANLGLGLQYQRVYGAGVSAPQRIDFVASRQHVARALGVGGLPVLPVASGGRLPRGESVQELARVGDCDGLYSWNLSNWFALTGTRASGTIAIDVIRGSRFLPAAPVELARLGAAAAPQLRVDLASRGGDRLQLRLVRSTGVTWGNVVSWTPGIHRAVVSFDPYLQLVDVVINGAEKLRVPTRVPFGPVAVGPSLPGFTLRPAPESRARCRSITSG